MAISGILLLTIPCAAGAQPGREAVTTFLVGPSETAQLLFTYDPDQSLRAPVIHLRASQSLRFGNDTVPTGELLLWIRVTEAGASLVVTRNQGALNPVFDSTFVVARPVTVVEQLDAPVKGLHVHVRTTRHGIDTLGFTDRSTKDVNRVAIEYRPGTSSLLAVTFGNLKLTTPISAR